MLKKMVRQQRSCISMLLRSMKAATLALEYWQATGSQKLCTLIYSVSSVFSVSCLLV